MIRFEIMKTQEELNQLKHEYEALTKKIQELSEDEFIKVTGGDHCSICCGQGSMIHAPTFDESSNKGKIKIPSTKSWFNSGN